MQKKRIVLLTIGLLLLTIQAQASTLYPTDADALYQIFNAFFYETNDEDRMSSDIELLNNSGTLLADGEDLVFGQSGEELRIEQTWSNAAFGNELGYMDGDTYHALIDHSGVESGSIYEQDITFTLPDGFTFADTVYVQGDAMQRWYADARLNELGANDHFLAFSIADQALLDVFNASYGTSYTAGLDAVWMIAFEDMNLGDADFDDLVAVISRPADLHPTPVPGSIMLLFSGMLALVGLRSRKRRWT